MNNKKKLLLALFGLFFAQVVFGASFQIFNGLAYTNPAELMQIDNQQVQLVGTFIVPYTKFEGTVASVPTTAVNDRLVTLPSIRVAGRYNDRLVFAVDVTQPFASDVRYSKDNIVSILASKTTIDTVNITPQFAAAVTKKFMVGAGVDVQNLTVDLNQTISPTIAGEFKNHVEGWSVGWHVGAVFRALQGTFLGASYFSSFDYDVRGPSTFPGLTPTEAKSSDTLPATAIFDITQFITRHWLVRGDVSWTNWDVLSTIRLDNTVFGTQSIALNYENSWRGTLGTQYDINEKWRVKGGISYDESPTTPPNRSPRAPDNNIFGVGGGVHYQINKAVGVDVDYAHGFIKSVDINNTTISSVPITSVGRAQLNDDAVSIHLTINT